MSDYSDELIAGAAETPLHGSEPGHPAAAPPSPLTILRYDLSAIDLRPWARSVLEVDELEQLHRRPDPIPFGNYVDRLRYYANSLRDNFAAARPLYERLLSETIAPLFGGLVQFQRPPSFRCHLPGVGTASAFHRDGDPKYGVTRNSINAWVPLTRVAQTNSIYIETMIGSGRHRPVTLEPGEILVFDAYHLEHGSIANRTETTRVSCDLRFVPVDKARAQAMGLYPSGHIF
jgi:hypothetical protein